MQRSFGQNAQPDWRLNSSVPNPGNSTSPAPAPTYYHHNLPPSPSPFQLSSGHHPHFAQGYDNMTMPIRTSVPGTINPSAMTIDSTNTSNYGDSLSERATPAPTSYHDMTSLADVSFATPPPRATATPATPALSTSSLATSSSTPQGTQGEKRAVKKRKSWGQELPTPKTNLPPRKRAKTDDEKEQRRIERVLRNRAAAQSSRERKRLEVEKLELERDDLAEENAQLRQEREQFLRQLRDMAKMKQFYKSKFESCFAQLVSSNEGDSNYVETKTNKKIDKGKLRGALVSPELTPSPPHFALSPTLTADLLPEGSTQPTLNEDSNNDAVTSSEVPSAEATAAPAVRPASPVTDMTQHPAAVLCGLQCQSVARRTRQDPRLSTTAVAFALVFCVTVAFSTMTTLSSLLPPARPLLQTFAWMLSTLVLTSFFTVLAGPMPLHHLRNWLTLKVASLRTETLKRTVTLATPFWRRHSQPMTARICFTLRQLLTRSLTLARPMTDATGKAMRLKKSCGDAIRARPAPRNVCFQGRHKDDSSLVVPKRDEVTFESGNSNATMLRLGKLGSVVSTNLFLDRKRQSRDAKTHHAASSMVSDDVKRDWWKTVAPAVLHCVV
ncbi:hypothetical protein L228DRAFT_249044 [Xylona heveae TC161]|uniref:BZIP domain-containing protein n=1 Tax=Xylona heveae (strain CBS 132557 / TC161) TaxID=1328760 RepID=A0A165FQG6_XYLHT|nr:hypothetical protein L228DRAFT_249044 [Xylona heveae TC161]KZF21256.1 hypothetical protein L228DRAFT_249044 [Xylona heveae TC161]